MSPLAKLLQITPVADRPRNNWRSVFGNVWKRFVEVLRSARVQRRVRRLEVVERVSLSNKQSIVLLRVDEREFVVGCCGDSVVLLAPPPAERITEPVKEQPRPRARAKKKIVHPPVLAPVESVAIAVPAKPQRSAKAKPTAEVDLPLKRRVPTKARLVKSFAGRSR